jgi:hypothetical protein
MLPEWLNALKDREGRWRHIHVPLGAVVAILAVGYAAASHLDTRYVFRAEFRNYKYSIEARLLEIEIRRLELETLRLSTTREAYPAMFDAVDRALLMRQEAMLAEAKQELWRVRERMRREEDTK